MRETFMCWCQVWLRHISYLLGQGDEEGARKVLERSFASLPKRKHVKVLFSPCCAIIRVIHAVHCWKQALIAACIHSAGTRLERRTSPAISRLTVLVGVSPADWQTSPPGRVELWQICCANVLPAADVLEIIRFLCSPPAGHLAGGAAGVPHRLPRAGQEHV